MMFEQIRANRRKTIVLVVAMFAVLVVLGFVIGEAYARGGGIFGLAVALGIWAVMSLVSYFQGDSILLAVSGAKKIEKEDNPRLYNVVEEMTIASGRSKVPDIYVMNDQSMNAFAVGRNPEKAAVAITAGLLERLDRDELQGVMAHEMAHIVNRDVLLMTMVGIMLGAIVIVSQGFLRSLFFTGGRGARYSGRSRGGNGGGQAQLVFMLIAVVLAILAPILAQLIYFAVSRRREYLADASAAVYTRYPAGLAGALEKLGGDRAELPSANKATAPMYIVNPFKKAKLNELTSTHPPLDERIRILRNIGGNVSFGAYQQAWSQVSGKKAGQLPQSAVEQGEAAAVREAQPESPGEERKRHHETGDILRKANGFLFLPCSCGAKLKIPPDAKKQQVKCPRCSRTLALPLAELEVMRQALDSAQQQKGGQSQQPQEAKARKAEEEPLSIERKEGEWQSFKCRCGATKSLSPQFSAPQTRCNKCGRTIHIT